MTMLRRKPIWLYYLAFGIAGGLAYYFGPVIGKSGPFFNVLGLSSVVAILVGIRLHKPPRPLPWYLFALGQALFIAGDVITYNYADFFGHDIPFPSIGDLAYLAVYPCLMAGMLLMIHHRSPGKDRDSLIDSLIITIGAGILSWEFLMAPYAHDQSLSVAAKLVSIAYPMMDLLLLGVVVRIGVGAGKKPPSFSLLTAGVAALLATDAAYNMVQLSGAIYQNGGPLEAGWLSFYLLIGASALHPSMRTMTDPVAYTEAKNPRRRLLILMFASIVSPTINVVQAIRGKLLDPGIVSACSIAVFLLVFARMRRLMVDITEYRRAEAQLKEAEAKYRVLVESLPAIVYIAEFGPKGRWLYVSPQIESILGFSQEEWTSSPDLWHLQVHPDDLTGALADEQRVLDTGQPLDCEYRIRSRDGRVVWIREEAEALRDESGKAMVLQGVMYDVTQQKDSEEILRRSLAVEQDAAQHLRELNDMKDSFLQAVSHDLRTPLTSIMGSALTLRRSGSDLSSEDAVSLMEIIASNSVKLSRLLSDLLDVDRLARGIVEPRRQDVDLRDLILRVLAECGLGDHPVDLDAPPMVAYVDPSQVERMVENLLTNASRYTPKGCPLWIGLSRTQDAVLITIADAGPGVPDELKAKIFEPFRQGAERVSHSPGVGIGLSLVAKFAELHGGRAWVEDRPGGGASFKILLPEVVHPASGVVPAAVDTAQPADDAPDTEPDLGLAASM
jgi:PAS domain S-box-containing protein